MRVILIAALGSRHRFRCRLAHLVALVALVAGSGCTSVREVPLEAYLADPGHWQGAMDTITGDVAAIQRVAGRLRGRRVQVTGLVDYDEIAWTDAYWGFRLYRPGEPGLRCYEWHYHAEVPATLATLLRAAERDGEPVAVAGVLVGTDELELDWVHYRDWHIDTDRLPVRLPAIH